MGSRHQDWNSLKYNIYFSLHWCQHPPWAEEAKLRKPKTNQEFVWRSCVCSVFSCNFPTKLVSCVPPAGRDILDLVTRLMRTHDLIYGGGHCVSEGEGFTEAPSGGRQQWFRASWCHFDREQRGPCWCQRGARHTDKPHSSSLFLHCNLSFNDLTSQPLPLTALPRTSDSLILMLLTDIICVSSCAALIKPHYFF